MEKKLNRFQLKFLIPEKLVYVLEFSSIEIVENQPYHRNTKFYFLVIMTLGLKIHRLQVSRNPTD